MSATLTRSSPARSSSGGRRRPAGPAAHRRRRPGRPTAPTGPGRPRVRARGRAAAARRGRRRRPTCGPSTAARPWWPTPGACSCSSPGRPGCASATAVRARGRGRAAGRAARRGDERVAALAGARRSTGSAPDTLGRRQPPPRPVGVGGGRALRRRGRAGALVLVDGDLQPDWRIPSSFLADAARPRRAERGVVARRRHQALVAVARRRAAARPARASRPAARSGARAHVVGAGRPAPAADVGAGLQVVAARLDPDARFAFRVDLPAGVDPEAALGALSALCRRRRLPRLSLSAHVADRLAACPGWLRQRGAPAARRPLRPGRRAPRGARAGLRRPPRPDGAVHERDATPRAGCSARTCSRARSAPRPTKTCSSASCWSAVDDATGRRYLFRIVDVTYGTEHREPGWAERVAGTLLADDARDEAGAHPLYEQARRTYRVAELPVPRLPHPPDGGAGVPQAEEPADAVLAGRRARGGRLRVPAHAHGRPARRPAAQRRDRGRLRGRHPRRSRSPPTSASSPPPAWASPTSCRCWPAACCRPRAATACCSSTPTASTAPTLARHPWAAERLRTYAARRLPEHVDACGVSLAELTVDDLRTAYEWSRPQEEALFELERHYGGAPRRGLAWLLAFSQLDDLPGFRDVELGGRVALNTLQVVHRRARRIVGLARASRADPSVSVGGAVVRDLIEGKVVLVDVSGLGSTEEVLVASFLTRKVLDRWSDAYLDDPERHERLPVVAVVLEEAQRVLSPAQRPRVERVPPGGARGPQVQGRPVRHHPAAEAARRRAAQPVQHLLRPRPGRREGPQHPAGLVQAGHLARSAPRSRRSCPASASSPTSRRRSRCRPRSHLWDDARARHRRPRPRPREVAAPNVAALVD